MKAWMILYVAIEYRNTEPQGTGLVRCHQTVPETGSMVNMLQKDSQYQCTKKYINKT